MIHFFLNGQKVNPPSNFRELSLGFDFGSGGLSTPFIDLPNFEWVNSEASLLNEWIQGGLKGEYGLLEGVPLEIDYQFSDSEKPERVFSGYVSLFSESVNISCDRILAPALSESDPDSLKNIADSFSFAYLRKQNVITPADYVDVFYLLNKVPDGEAAAIVAVTVFLVGKEVYYTIDQIVGVAGGMIANVITIPAAIIRIIFLILYLILTIIALVKLLEQLKDLLFPQPRTYRGMRVKTLFERGCQQLGLKFSSTIFNKFKESNLVILPSKYGRGVPAGLDGFDSGYPEMSFGQFIDIMVNLFNGDYRIEDGVFYFERKDKLGQFSGFNMRELPRGQRYSTNANELVANYLISFQTDSTDPNTIQNTQGTRYQVTTEPKIALSRRAVGIQGLREIGIPFARATRKNSETIFEKVYLKVLYNSSVRLNSVIKDVSGSRLGDKWRKNKNKPRYKNKIKEYDVSEFTDRDPTQVEFSEVFDQLPQTLKTLVGMMMVHQEHFSQDKLCIVDPRKPGYLDTGNNELTAQYFWDNYHYIESPVPDATRPRGNQYIKYENVRIPLCGNDFIRLSKYNVFYIDSLQSRAEIIQLRYNPFTQEAVLSFRVNQLYSLNLKETKTDGVGTNLNPASESGQYTKVSGQWFYVSGVSLPFATLNASVNESGIYSINGDLTASTTLYRDIKGTQVSASGTYFNKATRAFVEVDNKGTISLIGQK